jgi:hypothetical protein
MNRLMLFSALLAILWACNNIALGSEWDQVYIDISPSRPNTSTPVSFDTWTWFGDPGQSLVSATYTRNDYQIDIDVIMLDLHRPGVAWPTVMTQGGGTVNLGTLPLGHYDVLADILMVPWGGAVPVPFRTGATHFDVVPYPSPIYWRGGASSGPAYWSAAQNWLPNTISPDSAGLTVLFGSQNAANNAVNIDFGNKSVGNITFLATTGTTIDSSGCYNLTLDNLGGASTINVAGTHTINVPLILKNNASVTGSGNLNLAGGVSGDCDLTVSSNVTVESIQVDNLTLSSGATLAIAPLGAPGIVPEPSALALLFTSALGLTPFVRCRRK